MNHLAAMAKRFRMLPHTVRHRQPSGCCDRVFHLILAEDFLLFAVGKDVNVAIGRADVDLAIDPVG